MKKFANAVIVIFAAMVLCLVFTSCAEEEHTHSMIHTEAIEPKCNAEGNVEYWTCGGCKKQFLDSEGKTEALKQSDIILEMTECNYRGCVCRWCGDGTHSLKYNYAIEPFCDTEGRLENWECLTCELVFSDAEAKNELESVIIPPQHKGGTEIRDKRAPTEEYEGYTGNTYCLGCGTVLETGAAIEKLDHTHKITHHPYKPAGCTFNGSVEYWSCDVCDKRYSDEELVTEITDTVIIGSHVMTKVEAKEATCLIRGNIEYWSCSKCKGYYADEKGKTAISDKNSVNINYKVCNFVNERCIWCKKVDQWCVPSLTVVDDLYLVVTGIESYSGTDIVIESSYGGLPVKEIAEGAFAYYKDITSVELPDSVVRIGEKAFSGCISLVSIKLPKNLVSVGENAFAGCYKLFEVINRSSLDVKVGKNTNGMVAYYAKIVHNGTSKLKRVDEFIFCAYSNDLYLLGYTGIDTVLKLPQSYNGASYRIYNHAFSGRSDIMSVTLPSKLLSIGDNAFDGCEKLAEIVNNSNLKLNRGDIINGSVAFYALEVHSGESKIAIQDGFLYYKLGNQIYVLGYEGNATSLSLPTSIENSTFKVIKRAFAELKNITSVNTGGATELGEMAFYGCTSLKRAELSYQLESIGASAFYGCEKLESVRINGTLNYIGQNVFFMCPNLKNKPF